MYLKPNLPTGLTAKDFVTIKVSSCLDSVWQRMRTFSVFSSFPFDPINGLLLSRESVFMLNQLKNQENLLLSKVFVDLKS